MKGRWRLFRHDAGRVAGPPALAYVVLYAAAMAVGYWTMARFGTATVWLANGVVTAALLQLHRRPALAVLAACAALDLLINGLRGAPAAYLIGNIVLNLGMAMAAAVQAQVPVPVIDSVIAGTHWALRTPPLPPLRATPGFDNAWQGLSPEMHALGLA